MLVRWLVPVYDQDGNLVDSEGYICPGCGPDPSDEEEYLIPEWNEAYEDWKCVECEEVFRGAVWNDLYILLDGLTDKVFRFVQKNEQFLIKDFESVRDLIEQMGINDAL